MYAVDLARALEIPEVIVPLAPGVTSALGLLQVDLAVRTQRSVLMAESAIDEARLGQLFDEMEHETRQKLLDSGYSEIGVKRQIDVRYFGQSRYMTIDAPNGVWTSNSTAAVVERFNAEHEREYGYVMPSHINQVELANLRVVTETPVKKAQIRRPEHVSGTIPKRTNLLQHDGFHRHTYPASRAGPARQAAERSGDRRADRHHHCDAAWIDCTRRRERQPGDHGLGEGHGRAASSQSRCSR